MNLDLTDIVTMMQKVDANHDPSEANALLTAGGSRSLGCARLVVRSLGPGSMVECRRKSGARPWTHSCWRTICHGFAAVKPNPGE